MIEGSETSSPPRFPAREEAWVAPPSPLCLITTDSSCQAGGDTGADSPARRNRGYDGPTPQGSHDDDGRWRALRALARRNATSTWAIRPKKSVAVCGGINPYTLTARLGPAGLAHYETSLKLDPTAWSFVQGNKT